MSLYSNFHFKQIILVSWINVDQKWNFQSKTGQINITIEFNIFDLVYVPSLILNKQICYFGTNLPKSSILVQSKKSEHHSSALKGYFWYKTEKLNIAIKSTTFELVQIINFILNTQFLSF